jgi:phage gp29-like protein
MKLQNRKLQYIVERLGLGDKPPLKAEMLEELAPANGVSLLGALASVALPEDSLPGGSVTYRRMLSDPQVKACLQTKKFAALSQSWEVHAASASPEDQQIAAFVRSALSGMRGSVLDALYDVLDALAFGASIVEINYKLIEGGPNAGMVGLANLKSKDPSGFTFEVDAFANVLALRGLDGAAYPPDKFLRYCWLPLYESPLGQSDLQAAYKPWFVKQQLLKWWAKYLEKFGMPTVTGTYDPNRGYGPDQQRELLAIVAQVHNESAVVLPSDMHLGLLETARAQSAGFAEAIDYLDRAIAKSILGQTLTTDSPAQGGGSYALGSVHQDVLRFYVDKLRRDLEGTVIGAQLLAPLVAYNFGPQASRPVFVLGKPSQAQKEAGGKLITELVAGNVIAPSEPWIRSYLGLPAAPD